jgi:hypothetical protein
MIWLSLFLLVAIVVGRIHSYRLDRLDELHAGGIFKYKSRQPLDV